MERRGRTRLLEDEAAPTPAEAPAPPPPEPTTDAPSEPVNSADALLARQRRWREELARYRARKRPEEGSPRQS